MEIDVRDLLYYVSVVGVGVLDGCCIEVEFSDGNRVTCDMGPLIGCGVFRALSDDELFASVHASFGVDPRTVPSRMKNLLADNGSR